MASENNDNSTLYVLVADDDTDISRLIDMMLREMGIQQVHRFRDGQSAWAEYRGNPDRYHVIISDWTMPEMSGLDFLKNVREIRPDALFMMLTARSDANAIEQAKKAGVTSYIAKPFSLQELMVKMMRLIEILLERKAEQERQIQEEAEREEENDENIVEV